MSVLVVGLSHKGAPLATLERAALTGDALGKLLHDVLQRRGRRGRPGTEHLQPGRDLRRGRQVPRRAWRPSASCCPGTPRCRTAS